MINGQGRERQANVVSPVTPYAEDLDLFGTVHSSNCSLLPAPAWVKTLAHGCSNLQSLTQYWSPVSYS